MSTFAVLTSDGIFQFTTLCKRFISRPVVFLSPFCTVLSIKSGSSNFRKYIVLSAVVFGKFLNLDYTVVPAGKYCTEIT